MTPADVAVAAIHPRLRAVFAELDRARVAWCLIRGVAELERGSEADMLVAGSPLVEPLLRGLGWRPLTAWGHRPHHFYVTYDRATDRWLKLDLQWDLALGRFQSESSGRSDTLLGRRVTLAGGVRMLHPADECWALAMHYIFDPSGRSARHRSRIAELVVAHGARSPVRDWAEEILGKEQTAWLHHAMLSGAWAEVDAAVPRLRRPMSLRRRIRWPAHILLRKLERRAGKVALPMLHPARSLALLGPDGAGKSTLARAVAQRFYFPVAQQYMGLYPSDARPLPRGLGLLTRLARLWMGGIRAVIRTRRGCYVVFDRHPLEGRVERPAGRVASLRRWLLGRACPRPDRIVVLDAPGDILHDRSGEHSAAILEGRRREYLKLAERFENAIILDAERSVDELRRDVTDFWWRDAP